MATVGEQQQQQQPTTNYLQAQSNNKSDRFDQQQQKRTPMMPLTPRADGATFRVHRNLLLVKRELQQQLVPLFCIKQC